MLMQGQILLAAAFNGDADAASFLCELYANSTASSGTVIDPDLRGAAYHAAVAHLGGCLSLSGTAHNLLMLWCLFVVLVRPIPLWCCCVAVQLELRQQGYSIKYRC